MKAMLTTVILLFIATATASAQDTSEPSAGRHPPGLGYVFVGDTTKGLGLAGGFGGEFTGSDGLGVGLEAGAVGLSKPGDGYYDSYATGEGSADVMYHYFSRNAKLCNFSPFATGGYTILFGHNPDPQGKDVKTDGFNLGGGVDLFASKRLGLRFDVRYYGHGGRILKNLYPDTPEFSFVAFRFGLTFR